MAKQWKRSLSQSDILSDGTPFAGENVDVAVSESVAQTKEHDLRFIREMSRLFFDRSLDELNFDDGTFEIFTDTNNINVVSGFPLPILNTGVNGTASFGAYDLDQINSSNEDRNIGVTSASHEFSPDGNIFWTCDPSGQIVEHKPQNPFNLGNVNTSTQSFSLLYEDPVYILWKEDGSTFWHVGRNRAKLIEYTVGTAFDIGTASATGDEYSLNASQPEAFAWNDDGSVGIELDSNGKLREHQFSTPYDLTTGSYTGTDFRLEDGNPLGFTWDVGGEYLWTVGNDQQFLFEYETDEPYDITSLSYTGNRLSISQRFADVSWEQSGSQLFFSLPGSNDVNEYILQTTSSPAKLSTSFSLGFEPSSLVVEDTTVGAALDVSYTITDSDANSVTVPPSGVGSIIDASPLSAGELTMVVTLDAPETPPDVELLDFAVYFE